MFPPKDANGMYVPGLQIRKVYEMEDVENLMETGRRNRSTYSTNLNEHSSRSHMVYSIYVHDRETGQDPAKRERGMLVYTH